MRSSTARWIVVLGTFSLVACSSPDDSELDLGRPDEAISSPDDAPAEEERRDDQDLAPDFSVETFIGETFTLSEQRGSPVILNFWESW